jgi:hypothetical protein
MTTNRPVRNATLIGADTFYPSSSTGAVNGGLNGSGAPNPVGYVAFTCSETYWSNDPYYQAILGTAVLCSAPTFPTSSEYCVASTNKSAVANILPVHFIMHSPSQVIIKNVITGSNHWNSIASLQIAGISLDTSSGNSTLTGLNNPIFDGFLGGVAGPEVSITVGSSAPFSFRVYWLNALWVETDGEGGTPRTGSYTVRCPAKTSGGVYPYYSVNATMDMAGQTCDISCDERAWSVDQPNGIVSAPLLMHCHN